MDFSILCRERVLPQSSNLWLYTLNFSRGLLYFTRRKSLTAVFQSLIVHFKLFTWIFQFLHGERVLPQLARPIWAQIDQLLHLLQQILNRALLVDQHVKFPSLKHGGENKADWLNCEVIQEFFLFFFWKKKKFKTSYLFSEIRLPNYFHLLPRLHFVNVHVKMVVEQFLGLWQIGPLIEKILEQGLGAVRDGGTGRVSQWTAKGEEKPVSKKFNSIRGSLWHNWRPPSRTKTKHLFINLRVSYSNIFPLEVESFFLPFQSRLEKRKKLSSLKRTSTSPWHHDQLPFESKLPFPVCFLSVLRTGENSGWIDDQVEVGEEIVESR